MAKKSRELQQGPRRGRPSPKGRLVLRLEALEDRLAPAILTVNTLADEAVADNVLSLREAIRVVDAGSTSGLSSAELAQISGTLGNNDTIQYDSGLAGGTIALTSGALELARSVMITGPGAGKLTINGQNASRVFFVDQGPTVTLSGLTVAGGNVVSSSTDFGGGLLNNGTLTVNNCTFTGNAAGSGGGGIYNQGALTLNGSIFMNNTAAGNGGGVNVTSTGTLAVNNCMFISNTATGSYSYGGGLAYSGTSTSKPAIVSNSTFSGNSASGSGGGLFNDTGATMTATNCSFASNHSNHDGGGMDDDGQATVTDSTFSNNTADGDGGGLQNYLGSLTLRNSTFYGNTAGYGGGVTLAGPATVANCTITANRAMASGGGIYNPGPAGMVFNTIVAGNFNGASGTTPDDINGTLDTSSAYNLVGTGGSGGLTNGVNGNQVGVSNPGLGSLANNGGPTQTVALLPGSPAIDHGNNAYVNPAETDQRGLTRIVNGTVDIGAIEVQSVAVASFRVTGFPSPTMAGSAGTFTVTALDANGNMATGYTGTLHFTSSDGRAALPGDYTFTSSDVGSHTFSATLNSVGTQSITVTDTANSTITGSQTGITVNPASVQPPTIISATANPNPVTGKTTQLMATATDPNGARLTYTWSLVSGTRVTFGSNNGTASGNSVTAMFSMAGNYTFQATVTDSFGASSTKMVTVTVQQTLASVTVSPAKAGIRLNGTVQFMATALDQFGKALSIQPSFTWMVVSGPGTINSNGLYTGISAGTAHIQAKTTVNGTTTVSNTAVVTVKKHSIAVNWMAISEDTDAMGQQHTDAGEKSLEAVPGWRGSSWADN